MVNPKQKDAVIVVYHLEHSRSLRLLWLLEHLDLKYEVKSFKRDPKTKLAPAELKKIHPLGRVPMLTIEEGGGKRMVLAETSAIMVHLVERFSDDKTLLPPVGDWEARHRVQCTSFDRLALTCADWVAYAEDSIMSPLMYAVVFAQLPKQAPFIARPLLAGVSFGAMTVFVKPLIHEHLRWIESQLDQDYIAGSSLTLGDFMMHFAVDAAKDNFIKPSASKYPRLLAYLERLEAEPAFKRALEQAGGPSASRSGRDRTHADRRLWRLLVMIVCSATLYSLSWIPSQSRARLSSVRAMRIGLGLIAAICVSVTAADASQAPFATLRHHAEPLSTSLIDLLSQDTDYSLLIRLLQRSRLITTLNALKNATFFAPTNAAIRSASQARPEIALALSDGGVDNIQARLRATLLYHVLNLTLPYNVSQGVDQVDMYETLLLPHADEGTGRPGEPPERDGPPDSLLGGEGQRVRITTRSSLKSGNTTFVGVDALGQGGVPVVKSVVSANNGQLIGVGEMLEPPKSLRHVIEDHPSLKKLSALLTPELLHNLTTEPHLTIFAPHDSSWDALDDLEWQYLQSGYATRDTEELVGHHASAAGIGDELPAYAYRLMDAGNASVLSGETVKVRGGNGTALRVNGSHVTEYDILASNGVLHIVSDLLLPRGTLALNVEKYLLTLNATRFVSLLRSSNLSDYVQSTDGAFTILAPRDDVLETALTNLPLEGSTKMEELLRYHIIEGQWTPKQLDDGQLLGSVLRPDGLNGSPQRVPVTVAVSALAEPRQGNGDIAFGDANVIAAPIVVGNSIIYLISAVLEPPPDVIEAAMGNLRLSTFVAGVYAAHIESQLRRESAISYFIPTNEAFNALGLTMNYLLLKSSLLELRQLIRYHGARGLIYLENVTAIEPIPKQGRITLPTLEGSDLILDRKANGSAAVSGPLVGGVAANGERRPAQILPSSSPILTDTGVLHVIDQVELPPTLDISISKLMKGGHASTMIGLLQQAGYEWVANGDDAPRSNDSVEVQKKRKPSGDMRPSYTVLCPTDKAFTRINLTAYLADPEALRTLVKLHIIRSDGPVLETPTQEGHPLRLEDEGGYRTLLSDDGDKYGELTFRSYGGNEDNWLVGIRGARGTGARNDWATVLSFGQSTPKLSGQARGGGVLLIDSVLIPYHPSWWVRYGWAIAAAVVVVIIVSGLSFMLWRLWRTKRPRQHYEALAGEED